MTKSQPVWKLWNCGALISILSYLLNSHVWKPSMTRDGLDSRLVIRESWHFAVFKISFLLRCFRVDLQQWQNLDEKVLLSMHAGFCVCVCVCVFVNGDDLYFYSPNLFIIACSYLDEIGLPIFTRNSKWMAREQL
jgi:hypothetical protein